MHSTSHAHSDIIVVGAGIVGLAHALAAVRAGHTVRVFEQDARAVGASIRNFGHLCITPQSGELLDLALAARPIWRDLAEAGHSTTAPKGTLVVARSETEATLLAEFEAARGAEQVALLDAQSVADKLHRGSTGNSDIVSGALFPNDLVANPRRAVAELTEYLQSHERVHFHFEESVHEVLTGQVSTTRGAYTADHIFVCAGHTVARLFPSVAAQFAIGECALNMARVELASPRPIEHAVFTGTSMLRYDGLAEMPAADALRAEIAANRPELLEIEANVMFTTQGDGSIIVGDSHEVDRTIAPFMNERWTNILLDEFASVIGTRDFSVVERWQGVYAKSPLTPLVRETPLPGVSVVVVTTGVGMTISLGLGARSIEALHATDFSAAAPAGAMS